MRAGDAAAYVDAEGIVHTAIRWPGGWMLDCRRWVVRVVVHQDEKKLTCMMCIGLIGMRD